VAQVDVDLNSATASETLAYKGGGPPLPPTTNPTNPGSESTSPDSGSTGPTLPPPPPPPPPLPPPSDSTSSDTTDTTDSSDSAVTGGAGDVETGSVDSTDDSSSADPTGEGERGGVMPDTATTGREQVARETVVPGSRLYMVKVSTAGGEGDHEPLPVNAIHNMDGLLERLRTEKFESGKYRIYFAEPDFPPQKVLEFYKSENSLSDTIREAPRGSNPLEGDSDSGAGAGQPQTNETSAITDDATHLVGAAWTTPGGLGLIATAAAMVTADSDRWKRRRHRLARSATASLSRAARRYRRLQRQGP